MQTFHSIACFISQHGLGHAGRSCATIEALLRLDESFHFHLFSKVPRWFFEDLPTGSWTYHSCESDVGVVQTTPLIEDMAATVQRLDTFLPFHEQRIDRLAHQLLKLNCRLILCDISALGIAVGQRACLPSVLVENFTWDWIYAPSTQKYPGLLKHIKYLEKMYSLPDLHIQTRPVCDPKEGAFQAGPLSRLPRRDRASARSELGISEHQTTVLLSLGRLLPLLGDYNSLKQCPDVLFLIPGATRKPQRVGNLWLLPQRGELTHPELVHLSDALVAKAGYSTLAEAACAGVPIAYLHREGSREGEILDRYIRQKESGIRLTPAELDHGNWAQISERLMKLKNTLQPEFNDADRTAGLIYKRSIQGK